MKKKLWDKNPGYEKSLASFELTPTKASELQIMKFLFEVIAERTKGQEFFYPEEERSLPIESIENVQNFLEAPLTREAIDLMLMEFRNKPKLILTFKPNFREIKPYHKIDFPVLIGVQPKKANPFSDKSWPKTVGPEACKVRFLLEESPGKKLTLHNKEKICPILRKCESDYQALSPTQKEGLTIRVIEDLIQFTIQQCPDTDDIFSVGME